MLLFAKMLRVSMMLWRPHDVQKFDADAILVTEILRKKRYILMIYRHFQCGLGLNQVKYARITITHACFISLTLAGSHGQCLNTQSNGRAQTPSSGPGKC